MAQENSSASEQNPPISALEIVPPTRANRVIRGNEISVYYDIHQGGAWPRHQRGQVEIVLFFDLTLCRLRWENEGCGWTEKEMRGRHICIIPARQNHECRLEGRAELLVLYADGEPLRKTPGITPVQVLVKAGGQSDPEVWILAMLLRRLCIAKSRPQARSIDALGSELVHRLLFETSENRPSGTERGPRLSHAEHEIVARYIQSNLHREILVEDLAMLVNRSRSQFFVLFTNTTGKSPFGYLKEQRLIHGYNMLLTGEYRTGEVAQAVGYDADHFRDALRTFCGFTPREILRRVRNGIAEIPENLDESPEKPSESPEIFGSNTV